MMSVKIDDLLSHNTVVLEGFPGSCHQSADSPVELSFLGAMSNELVVSLCAANTAVQCHVATM